MAAAAAVLTAIAVVGAPLAPLDAARTPALWKGLLAAPYGAIVEETACRVFLMGGVAWLLGRCRAGEAKRWIMPVAISAGCTGSTASGTPSSRTSAPT